MTAQSPAREFSVDPDAFDTAMAIIEHRRTMKDVRRFIAANREMIDAEALSDMKRLAEQEAEGAA